MPLVAWAANNLQKLLRRLRDVMGGTSLVAQAKIEQIVHIVAADLAVDVCSVYVLRAGLRTELIATKGFLKSAHNLSIQAGHGVVSDVVENARPLVLYDIKSHAKFSGDLHTLDHLQSDAEPLTSFAGVPLFYGGKVLGALVIQNIEKRLFNHDEIETLQTIAMIVAEMMMAGNLIKPLESLVSDIDDHGMHKVKGVYIHSGCAVGHAVLHQTLFPVQQWISDDTEHEQQRLDKALHKMHKALKILVNTSTASQNSESREIIETYQFFAQDRGWLTRVQKLITSGFTAEAAIKKTKTDIRLQIMQSQDLFFKERLSDFEDLANRLLKHLCGLDGVVEPISPRGVILIAKNMGSVELLDYEKYKLKGLILEESSQTAHIAIIARSLNIPVISQVSSSQHRINSGDLIIIDADQGEIIIRPSEEMVMAYEHKNIRSHRQHGRRLSQSQLPNQTKDGITISLKLNVSSLTETRLLHQQNVDGIGLYRTEIPFMMQTSYPNVRTQQQLYAQVLHEADHHPVVFRTLDIGGDKNLPYMPTSRQDNPSLGWRAIRIGLDLPNILRLQLRALMKAAIGRQLYIMFPFITVVEEFIQAKQLAETERQALLINGDAVPQQIHYGAMLETPAIVCMLDELLPLVDFVSIGSNDLAQYFFAIDRSNVKVEQRYQPISRPFLKILQHIIDKAAQYQKPLTICGEMAARPLDAAVLLALGIRNLSVAPAAIEGIKVMIRKLDLAKLQQYLAYLQNGNDAQIYNQIKYYSQHHNLI